MHFFPQFPLHLTPLAVFGLILLLGLIGGEITRYNRFIPRITGYIAIGFLVGPGGFNIISHSVLVNSRIFVDISLSLILFDLGRHLDFSWLRHDHGLLPMAIAESGFTFSAVLFVLHYYAGLPLIPSALAASIAMATSPAVVMMVAYDLASEGPVTRRTFILTSLNNLFALTAFIFLLPLSATDTPIRNLLTHSTYQFFGSIALGLIMFVVTKIIAQMIGKHKDNQFVLLIGIVVLSMGLAEALKFSSMLTLFILGMAARNLDYNHALMEIDFGRLARLFFILLFVVTGVHLQLQGLWQTTWIVLIFLLARTLAKTIGVWSLARPTRLTLRQTMAINLTLLPMSGIAIGMSNLMADANPIYGDRLLLIITAVVAILNIFGPILTQYGFVMTGEAITPTKESSHD